ncbi:succinyl-diaminopimelate desuccinylase [Entomomonas asaccharolytica]|uniref:Succinyl-diaminopimelate desuccinylase n=1 Tax=Entomomonas asaccharolytica TaxID=2785331 RepID=A0A974ND31_9GAMM|nr:succinyl-diaminopimelate desuccinylase [Entomomonas asaccharolytica]QQP84324.1 succinyl-diaminopimelate desuccinylase [Entomomonas asaccharolytica]
MSSLSATLQLAFDLISRPSVTPKDEGCQQVMTDRLQNIGFTIEQMPFADVQNFWASHGNSEPVFCFAGHTDVVPSGTIDKWHKDPFTPYIDDQGMLYGRGAADMKGSLAAMIVATERFIKDYPNHKGTITYLITSDEEGIAEHGTRAVVETLAKRNDKIDWCIVGEPSSVNQLGDMVKNGRRGSLNGVLTVRGKQGHVAYPHKAKNPIFLASPAITELANEHWDHGNEFFPPTSFQISNIHAGTGANNVIPGELVAEFNFRFSTESTVEGLKQRVEQILNKHQLDWHIDWSLSGLPFLTEPGQLLAAIAESIHSVTGITTEPSTSGGTSDGRFIATLGCQVVELGPVNDTIHQINEHIKAEDLNQLTEIYYQTLVRLLAE